MKIYSSVVSGILTFENQAPHLPEYVEFSNDNFALYLRYVLSEGAICMELLTNQVCASISIVGQSSKNVMKIQFMLFNSLVVPVNQVLEQQHEVTRLLTWGPVLQSPINLIPD